MSSIIRVFKYALQDMTRNLGLSFMTVFILVLMMLSINTLWSVDILAKEAIRLFKEQVSVSLYLSEEATAEASTELKVYLDSFVEVTEVTILTQEQVLEAFQSRHLGNQDVLAALDELGDNPFGPTIIVKTREPADYKQVLAALEVPEYDDLIAGKSFEGQEGALDRIQNITNRIERIGFSVSMLFGIIAFLIIFNTIRVAISGQKIEIGIKRLVGANNWFIRAPYLLQSVLFTFVSMAITIIVIYFALAWADPYISAVYPSELPLTSYYKNNILLIFGLQTLAVLILTLISSSLAMRRQLKV